MADLNMNDSRDLRALLVGGAAVGFFALGVALAQPAQNAAAPALSENGITAQVLETLTADQAEYFLHVATLSNPHFEGRGPGTRGNELAAEYLETYFKKLKLSPAFPSADKEGESKTPFASYRQPFSLQGEYKLKGSRLEAAGLKLVAGTDYDIVSASGSGEVKGELVFVGYGIESGKDGYNSFAELNSEAPLAGKIAVLLRYEPMDASGNSKWSEKGQGFSDAASMPAKLRSVADRGAAGIILVSPPEASDSRAKSLENLTSGRMGARRKFPVAMATPEAADRLLKAAGVKATIAELKAAADAGPGARVLGGQVELAAEVAREPVISSNVGAVLRGEGPLADQFIIIGGHFDHVGYGQQGSRAGAAGVGKIHPGADDNASGTAGVLMVAKWLARDYAKLAGPNRRSVMFVGFSGEELGLLGSRHMTRNMPIKAEQATVMLNMDMIGRVRFNKVDVSGVGSAEGFLDICKPHFDASGLKVRTLPGGQGPSDHASFYASNIPVLHFFTGLHPQYHMPEDVYQLINPVGGVQVAGIVRDLTVDLGKRDEALKFTVATGRSIMMEEPKADPGDPAPGSKPATPAKPSDSEKPADANKPVAAKPAEGAKTDAAVDPHGAAGPGNAGAGGIAGTKVRFGIAPGNYGDDQPGVEVADVYAGTSAAVVGIQKGDRLMKWNDKVLKSVEDWMPLLGSAKPGDKVEIELVRKGETKKVTVLLKAREAGDK